MRSNTGRGIILVILIAAVLFARLYRQTSHYDRSAHRSENHQPDNTSAGGGHQSVIDPSTSLIYTRHARCRMDCRHISEDDIREVLREGYINEAKSQQNQTPCPTYAIEEDRHKDGVRLRLVFAKCDHETKVVTCIDRDHEYECDCK